MITIELTENQFYMLLGSIVAVCHTTDGDIPLGVKSLETTRKLMDNNLEEYKTLHQKFTKILNTLP